MEIPFSIRNSSRGDPGRGGVVKYKLPDRLGQTRSDNRSREGGGATTPRRHPKFPAHFSPTPRVHGGGKLSAVFQTRSTSPFPSTLAALLLLATRERANILPRRASRHHARRPTISLVTGGRRRRRRRRKRYLYPVGLGTDVSIGALFYKYLSSFESIGKLFLCLSP